MTKGPIPTHRELMKREMVKRGMRSGSNEEEEEANKKAADDAKVAADAQKVRAESQEPSLDDLKKTLRMLQEGDK